MEKSADLIGSFSAQLGYSDPYMYNQLSVKTTEQRINQIILIQVGTSRNDNYSFLLH